MPNRIVALATGSANGGSGLYGIYISDDLGNTWTFRCCGQQPAGVPDTTNINLMGWSDQGTDDGGQYYYDLALDIDPNNGDKIHVGGVNHWISNDGGYTFTCPANGVTQQKMNMCMPTFMIFAITETTFGFLVMVACFTLTTEETTLTK